MALPGTLPENTGHPTRDKTHARWRDSVLVGPQTAGLPTVHNEDESGPGAMATPRSGGSDSTGGAVDYHRSQRPKK